MALFILTVTIILNSIRCLLSFQDVGHFGNELEITPSTYTGGRYFGVYKVEDTLNLSCILSNETDPENIFMDWIVPVRPTNRVSQNISHISSNLLNLMIQNVTENDSGEYKCTALNLRSLWYSEKSIIINVKNKKGECSDMMFQCSCGMCIHKRYTCDGFKDCHHGEDELSNYCGPGNPCDHKLKCPDGRCIPYTWCCDLIKEENCTTILKHECCIHMEKLTHDFENDIGFQYKQHKFYGWGFLQTTVYTTIGCALAFTGMFIIIIIVIVTCRMHTRRSVVSRCPVTNTRSVNVTRNVSENYVPFYDADVYFNRTRSNDIMSVNPLIVTYNINNGIQFVGRPVEPPPYCEILRSPPKEGPPPPYVSQENLSFPRRESTETKENAEDSESDTLLGSNNQISVISSNAIDIGERSSLVVREEATSLDGKLDSDSSPKPIVLKNSNQCLNRTINADINVALVNEALLLNNDDSQKDSSEARKNV